MASGLVVNDLGKKKEKKSVALIMGLDSALVFLQKSQLPFFCKAETNLGY